jgi:hypothetical protein|tara:strand:+ start:309 stop:725 length:417 start_codon:yes stop_codon:yes gene_type:complete
MDKQEYFELLKDKHNIEIEVLEAYKNKHIDWTFDVYESSDGQQVYVIIEGSQIHPDWYDGVYIDEHEYAERVMEIIKHLNDGDTIQWYIDDIDEHIDWEELAEELDEYEEEAGVIINNPQDTEEYLRTSTYVEGKEIK